MSLLDDVSIVVTPNGYKAGELYAVIPVPTEGADLINDGDFPLPNTEWTIGGGAEITVDGARINNTVITGNAYVIQSISGTVIGKQFVLTYDVIATNGEDLVIEGGITRYLNTSTTGTNRKLYYTWDRTNNQLVIKRLVANTDVTIDNVILQELTSADMDVTRATAATRVDENGLVNYAEVLGGEEVTCGDFSCAVPLDSWGTGTGWSIANGLASYDGSGGTQSIGQAGVVESSKTYKLTLDVVSNEGSGSNTIYLGGVIVSNIHLEVGNYIFFVTTSSTASFAVFGRSGENFVIDNVSIKEVTRANVPRIDYTGGGCPHILAEPQRTNNLESTQDFTDSFWKLTRVETVVASTVLSPDGTNFGFKVIPNSENNTHYLWYDYGLLSMPSGVEVTYSVFVKPFGYTNFQLASSTSFASRYQNFELTGDGVIGTGDVNSAKIEKIGDWYRCSITETTTGTTPRVLNIATPSSGLGRNPSFTGNGTDGVLLWGAQLEEGTYPTSYIPNLSTTSGSTVTRNQDVFTRDGIGSLINSTEGVLFVEMAALSDDSTNRQLTLSDGSDTNRIVLKYDNQSNIIQSFNRVSGVETASLSATVSDITQFSKIAIKYKLNDYAMWIDGVEVDTDNSGTTFPSSTLNKLSFGTSSSLFAKVKQLQVYDTALTDPQLAALTS